MNDEKERPKSDDEEQSARFIETAEKLEADDIDAFEDAIKKILAPKTGEVKPDDDA